MKRALSSPAVGERSNVAARNAGSLMTESSSAAQLEPPIARCRKLQILPNRICAGLTKARMRWANRRCWSRVTFVVGGGKAVRSKYSESMARDTQKNLKLVHVFPKVCGGNSLAKTDRSSETVAETCQRVSSAPWADFVEEALLVFLEELQEELQELNLAFQEGKHVSEGRRKRYDEFGSSDEVAERLRWLRTSLESSHPVKTADVDGATLAFEASSLTSRLQEVQPPASSPGPDTWQADDDLWIERRLEHTRKESEKLKKELSSRGPLQATREALPAYAQRRVIQEAVQESPVVVIEGDTGCGKSTQVPQFIFEDWLDKGHGGAANIIMTQPRRIRLGDLVGYSIRLESKRSFRTKILVCTTGVLLRRLENDPQLHNVTHIIVDECHERDLDTDFLLIILRDLLPKRPRLRTKS
eukprot:g24578.t1